MLMKVAYCLLRKCSYESVGYVDNSVVFGDGGQECQEDIDATVTLFTLFDSLREKCIHSNTMPCVFGVSSRFFIYDS